MQTLASEPHSANPAGSVLSALAENESQKDGQRATLLPLPEIRALNGEISWMKQETPTVTLSNRSNKTTTWQCILCTRLWADSSFFFFFFVFSPTRPPQKGYPHGINSLCCSVARQPVRWESPEHKQTLNHCAYSAGSKRESTTAKSLEPGYQTCSQTAHNICWGEVCWCVPSAHMHVILGGPLGNAATNRAHQQYLTAQLNRSDLVLYVDRIPDDGPSEVEA